MSDDKPDFLRERMEAIVRLTKERQADMINDPPSRVYYQGYAQAMEDAIAMVFEKS